LAKHLVVLQHLPSPQMCGYSPNPPVALVWWYCMAPFCINVAIYRRECEPTYSCNDWFFTEPWCCILANGFARNESSSRDIDKWLYKILKVSIHCSYSGAVLVFCCVECTVLVIFYVQIWKLIPSLLLSIVQSWS
jgi:hypothetical protein